MSVSNVLFFLYKRIFAALPDREKQINQRIYIFKTQITVQTRLKNVSLMWFPVKIYVSKLTLNLWVTQNMMISTNLILYVYKLNCCSFSFQEFTDKAYFYSIFVTYLDFSG